MHRELLIKDIEAIRARWAKAKAMRPLVGTLSTEETDALFAEAEQWRSRWGRACAESAERLDRIDQLTRELAEARDDAARFRHELKLAEGCLSKPHIDRDSVIAGLRLAQKRETGTWAIPAEKLRGEP